MIGIKLKVLKKISHFITKFGSHNTLVASVQLLKNSQVQTIGYPTLFSLWNIKWEYIPSYGMHWWLSNPNMIHYIANLIFKIVHTPFYSLLISFLQLPQNQLSTFFTQVVQQINTNSETLNAPEAQDLIGWSNIYTDHLAK